MTDIHPYIEKRIAELGYTDCHIQPTIIKINSDQDSYDIPAYNELYFLVGSAPVGTRIVSDTQAVVITQSISTSPIQPYYEFSGLIEITLPQAQATSIEFLRVIPK